GDFGRIVRDVVVAGANPFANQRFSASGRHSGFSEAWSIFDNWTYSWQSIQGVSERRSLMGLSARSSHTRSTILDVGSSIGVFTLVHLAGIGRDHCLRRTNPGVSRIANLSTMCALFRSEMDRARGGFGGSLVLDFPEFQFPVSRLWSQSPLVSQPSIE